MKKMIALLLLIGLTASLSMPVYASGTEIDIESVQAEMDEYLQGANLQMDVEDFTVSIREDIELSQYTDTEIAALLAEDIEKMKEILSSSESALTSKPQPRLSDQGNGEYTAIFLEELEVSGGRLVRQW